MLLPVSTQSLQFLRSLPRILSTKAFVSDRKLTRTPMHHQSYHSYPQITPLAEIPERIYFKVLSRSHSSLQWALPYIPAHTTSQTRHHPVNLLYTFINLSKSFFTPGHTSSPTESTISHTAPRLYIRLNSANFLFLQSTAIILSTASLSTIPQVFLSRE